MSKERAKRRAERERAAGADAERGPGKTNVAGEPHGTGSASGTGVDQDPATTGEPKSQQMKGRPVKGQPVRTTAGAGAKGGAKPPKKSATRTPAGNKRKHAPVGRADGPLARRRRFRVRLLVVLLLGVNIAAGVVWQDWKVSLAVFIVSVITAPLLAALLLRRRR